MSYKVCRGCGLTKELSEFYVSATNRDCRWGKCKVCVRARAQKYRREHLEQYAQLENARANLPHRIEARRKYQVVHKEEISEYKKRWAAENEEGVSASKRKYYELHRDEVIARSKTWGEENPDKVRQVIETVKASGGIDYAEAKMIAYRDEALSILSGFDNEPVCKGLEELVRYTTDRKY